MPNVNNFNDYVIKISRDNVFSLNDLVSKLVDIGYSRETMVSKMGEFALRGFVLDIFPINNDNPIRISFLGMMWRQLKLLIWILKGLLMR